MVQRSGRRSAAQWSQIIAEFDPAIETQQAFCDRRGLMWSTFRRWYGVTQSLSGSAPPRHRSSPSRFVQVATAAAPQQVRELLTVCAGEVRIECPASLSIESIVELVRAMRHEG